MPALDERRQHALHEPAPGLLGDREATAAVVGERRALVGGLLQPHEHRVGRDPEQPRHELGLERAPHDRGGAHHQEHLGAELHPVEALGGLLRRLEHERLALERGEQLGERPAFGGSPHAEHQRQPQPALAAHDVAQRLRGGLVGGVERLHDQHGAAGVPLGQAVGDAHEHGLDGGLGQVAEQARGGAHAIERLVPARALLAEQRLDAPPRVLERAPRGPRPVAADAHRHPARLALRRLGGRRRAAHHHHVFALADARPDLVHGTMGRTNRGGCQPHAHARRRRDQSTPETLVDGPGAAGGAISAREARRPGAGER